MERRESKGLQVLDRKDSKKLAYYFPEDYVAAEQNIETIGYFSASYKRRYPQKPNEAKEIILGSERHVRIVPSTYGYPNCEDQDFYRAFLKVCSTQAIALERRREGATTRHPQIPVPIGFSTNRILRYAGKGDNARNREAVRNWVKRSAATTIEGGLLFAKTRYLNQEFGGQLFSQYVLVGEKMRNGRVADMNYVWPAPWFLSNFYFNYYRRVDLAFHQRLTRPIAKGLYPLLETGWFASGGSFAKRYVDLCAHLFIQFQPHLSLVRQQLDPAHEELRREDFLESWDYITGKEATWTGVIRWWPGKKWLNEQEMRRGKKEGTDLALLQSQALVSQKINIRDKKETNSEILSRESCDEPPDVDFVRHLYSQLGQKRVTKQKIESGIRILHDLNAQGFSRIEISSALQWVLHNKQRFGDSVYSLGILPHVIGQALQGRATGPTEDAKERDKKAEARQEDVEQDRRRALEQQFIALPVNRQNEMQEQAISRLIRQGYDAKLIRIMKSLVRQEIYRMLQESEADMYSEVSTKANTQDAVHEADKPC
jgi:hypothetical protein